MDSLWSSSGDQIDIVRPWHPSSTPIANHRSRGQRNSTRIDMEFGETEQTHDSMGVIETRIPGTEVHLQCVSQGRIPDRFIRSGDPTFYQ